MQRIMNREQWKSEYLGDGLYAAFDGYQIWVMSSNGIEVLDEVAFEPSTLSALLRYADKFYKRNENGKND